MTSFNMRYFSAVSFINFSAFLLLSLWTFLFYFPVDCRDSTGVSRRNAQPDNDKSTNKPVKYQLPEPIELEGTVERLENNNDLQGLTNDVFTSPPYSVEIQISTLKGEGTIDRVVNLVLAYGNQERWRFIELKGSLPLSEHWEGFGAEIRGISEELQGLENFENRFVCYLSDSWGFRFKLGVQREQEKGFMPPMKKLICIVVKPWVQKWVIRWKLFV